MPRPLNWIRGEGTTKIQRGMGDITTVGPSYVNVGGASVPEDAIQSVLNSVQSTPMVMNQESIVPMLGVGALLWWLFKGR